MPRIHEKPSRRRYKAMLEDVKSRVWYAEQSGNHTNPYPVDDKRHPRFDKALRHHLFVASDFEDMCEVMGTDTRQWVRRVHPNPGPVRPMDQLI